jgi:hypothetical protein
MIQYIPTGKENGIKRSELCKLSGLQDREMRREIEAQQLQGVPIVNMENAYYIARNYDELTPYTKRERKRARQISTKVSALMFTDWFDAKVE